MIAAAPGTTAVFTPTSKPGSPFATGGFVPLRVVAWDDDGHALVIDGTKLTRISDTSGYEVFSAADCDPQGIVQLIPCEDDPAQVAWALCNDGKVRAVFYNRSDGHASAADIEPS